MTKANIPKNNTNRTGRVAVVTGSSKGIGKAKVSAFAKSGEYRGIVVNSRRRAEAQQTADEIKSSGYDSIAIEAGVNPNSPCRISNAVSITAPVDRDDGASAGYAGRSGQLVSL
jgi:NAD(P)-dependent dehydrogenase (short-subunit alcohol dehydrogenase family)